MRPPRDGLIFLVPVATLFVVLMAGAARPDDKTAAEISAALFPLLATEPDAADAEERTIMPMTTALPWGAVGFLDNGCTAALIDSRHVLAASHCFTFDYDGPAGKYLQGAWQTGGLVFFPNYHPARANPPRYAIDRAIVGSRVQTNADAPADWGIGHLSTPATDFPAVSIEPMARWRYPNFVVFAGYARDSTVYPKLQASYPQPAPGGYCPNFANNCWWIPAFVDPKCLALDEVNGIVRLDNFSCLTQGGNSGSPVLWDAGSAGTSAIRLTGVISGGGGFWSASRFQHAPRYAADVAVASHDDGTQRTQVFATDSDLARVVSRQRADATTSGPFTYFRDLGTVPGPGPLAAFRLKSGRPQVVVVSNSGKLYTSYVAAGGKWQAWQTLAGPAGVGGFRDVAATTDAAGLPRLFAIGSDHALYTTRATAATAAATWSAWTKIPVGADAQRVTAVRHGDNRQQAFVVSTAGAARSVWQVDATSGSAWSKPVSFGSTPALADISAGWTPDGRIQIFAIDAMGNGWTRTAAGSSPNSGWGSWTAWSVPLYAPKAATPPKLDGLVSLTASRWLESGGKVPVVFATDRRGNLYVTSYESGQWRPWRSFYN